MSGAQSNGKIMSSKTKKLDGMPSMPEILELVKILRKNGDKVLTGASKLSLSTKLLLNLNYAFRIIVDDTQDLENSFQVCNSSKIELFRDLKFLHDFVQKTVWLKVAQGAGDPKLGLDISKFRHLKFLELQKVCIDLVTGIQGVRGQLESISCTGGGGVGSVGRLLASCGGDAGIGFVWASLKRLALPYNGLGRLDKSLELAPWLQTLDLSHNLLVNVGELDSLENLKYVNLGYNKLEAAPKFSKANYHCLQVLVLKNNYIENLNGLQGLDYLIELDLSYNCLTEHSVLWPLEGMATLSWILLEGNPLSYHEEHRFLTIKHLHWLLSEKKFVLDRQPLDKNEKVLVSLNHLGILRSNYLKTRNDTDSLSDSVPAITSTSVENLNDLMASQTSEFMDSTGKNLTRTRRKKQIREAVIDDNITEIDTASSVGSTSHLEISTAHLETKKKMLALREKFGNDNWLVSEAGSYVQGIMGLEKSPNPVFTLGSNNNFAQVPNSPASSSRLDNPTLNVGPTGNFAGVSNSPADLPNIKNEESLNNPILNSGSSGDYADVSNSSTLSDESNDELRQKNVRAKEKHKEKESRPLDRNENESNKTAETIADPEMPPKIVEVSYDPEEEKGELFLVQKKSSQDEMDELFLVITPENITERDGITGAVKFRWSTNTILSCVMGRGQESSVDLIFDTTRNDRKNRTYYVEQEEAVKIVKTLGELIKARPIVLKVFKCIKCSTHFSHDPDNLIGITKISISEIQAPKCPSCRSTLVIETDELQTPDAQDIRKVTEPVTEKSYADEKYSAVRDESPENSIDEGNLQHSESHSSIGGIEGGPKPVTTSLVHFDSRPQAQISCSATSLDESRESTPSASTIAKRYESDIEVLSNPSQSSIEVLDDGSKASSTPSRKRSSEERRIAIAPTLLTIPDTAPAMAGLTESSSSGSLTDSICTTYENKVSRDSGSAGKRQTRKRNESETLINLGSMKETVTTPVGNLTSMLGGHGCLIGFETGKILSYATRSKRCSRCEHGEAASTHDCRKNFSESAKRMESDMATQLMTKNPWLSDENTHVSVLIADDDASTIAAVRRESTHPIEKWSDLNHAKKSLTSSLYALKLPRRTIEYFAQCFTAALKQNKGDAPKVESALKNVVPHAFGDHTGCGDWCKNRSSKEHFNARLPKGEPLSDPQLRLSLTQLFSKFANNAQKLAPCASSQANEAFNHTVASKHPKSQHYAASESLDFRVAAAVCQKNLGTRYIEKVCQKLSLSLSDLSIKHREQVDAEGRTRREKTKTVEYKRQRLLTKRNRTSKNSADSNKEGISYQSASGYEGVSELLKDTPSQGLLQSMKIGTNKGSLPKSEEGAEFLGSGIRYSYTNFSSVDHRIKLHLILNVFEQESEELVLLLRAEIVMQSLEEPFQGCLVLSTSKIYVLRITGTEGEDPQRWLHKETSWTMDRLRTFAPLPFKQGVLVEIQLPNRPAEEDSNTRILCILQDFQRTSNLLFYLADLPLPPSCELDFTIPEQCTSALQSLMLSSVNHRDGDTIRILALFSSAMLKHKTWDFSFSEIDKFRFGALIVTSSAVLLTDGKIEWLLPKSKVKPFTRMDQPLSNLIEVVHDDCSLELSFSDEVADIQEMWTLMFASTDAAEAVIIAIKQPWEELFSVPLQITTKTSDKKL